MVLSLPGCLTSVPGRDGQRASPDASDCAAPCGDACCDPSHACIDGECVQRSGCEGRECRPDGLGGNCGRCLSGFRCVDGTCVSNCWESDEEFCRSLGAECGVLHARDRCGSMRTEDCGTCGEGLDCIPELYRCGIIEEGESDRALCDRATATSAVRCTPSTVWAWSASSRVAVSAPSITIA